MADGRPTDANTGPHRRNASAGIHLLDALHLPTHLPAPGRRARRQGIARAGDVGRSGACGHPGDRTAWDHTMLSLLALVLVVLIAARGFRMAPAWGCVWTGLAVLLTLLVLAVLGCHSDVTGPAPRPYELCRPPTCSPDSLRGPLAPLRKRTNAGTFPQTDHHPLRKRTNAGTFPQTDHHPFLAVRRTTP